MGLERVASFLRAKRAWLLFFAVLAILYFAWGEVTRTRGAQHVDFQAAQEECASIGQTRYCVYQASGGTNGDILYHLHGRNLDAQIWNDDTYYTALIQAEWQRTGALPPTVVSVSYGSTWLLAPKGERPASGLLEQFAEDIALIEQKLGAPRRRVLLGESMGGLNVLVAGLTYPQQFDKVAALCPGVYDLSPFASFDDMRAAAQQTGANPKTAFGVWVMARDHVANDSEWERFSPLHLINRADQSYPALYVSNGLYDSFGNFEGSQELARRAEERGMTVEWRPLYGGHCSIDAVSLALFLVS